MKINSPPDLPLAVSTQAQASATKALQVPIAKATKDANSAGVAVTVSSLARSLEVANKGEPFFEEGKGDPRFRSFFDGCTSGRIS